jgi:hypothetical protein
MDVDMEKAKRKEHFDDPFPHLKILIPAFVMSGKVEETIR